MAATIMSIEAAKKAAITLAEEGKGQQALHDTVVAYANNRRQGTACTKNRSEVAGSGKKLWRQKGTGNARMGSRRSPIWRGGGVVFGPRPRDYSQKINIKTKRLALRVALTARISDGDVLTIPGFEVTDGKTKTFVTTVAGLTTAKKIAIVGHFDEMTFRAGRNVANVQLIRPEQVTSEDLLRYGKIILTTDAVGILSQRTAIK
jgi:large subunit ribosomal protein L4